MTLRVIHGRDGPCHFFNDAILAAQTDIEVVVSAP